MQYTIKDLENLSNIKAHTIRIWEKRYNLISPQRTDTNIRFYSDEDIKKLLNITALLKSGMKISHIAQLSNIEIYQKASFLFQNTGDYINQIKKLIISMVDLDEDSFNSTLNKAILSLGFEQTIIQIIYPFLDQIGVLWQTGNINPAHEHFISNLIRQKLIVAIDSVSMNKTPSSKKFTLFLPEGELHELGLLFSAYIIKKRGHRILYLGQTTPLDSIKEANKTWKTDYLIYFSTTKFNSISPKEFLTELTANFPSAKIIISSKHLSDINTSSLPNINLLSSPHQLITFLDNI